MSRFAGGQKVLTNAFPSPRSILRLRNDVEAALTRLLDDIEARIAEDQVMGGPPKGSASVGCGTKLVGPAAVEVEAVR